MKVQSPPVHLHIKLNRICAICARIENLCDHLYRVFSLFFFVLHQSSFLTSNFTHLPRSLHYMPYFTAHVILLFRVTSADKRVALYLRIGLHYLMCVASCNIRLFVYTYFMYSIEEKCRIFSYTPQQSMHFKREYCSGNDRVPFEQDKKVELKSITIAIKSSRN